jgi:hypothetical protein
MDTSLRSGQGKQKRAALAGWLSEWDYQLSAFQNFTDADRYAGLPVAR